MRNLLFILFLGIPLQCWSQQPLTGIKNGNWIIFQGSNQKQLPVHYYDVGNFDQNGLAYFAANGKYGVIDTQGTVVVMPSYDRLLSFGWGYFGGINTDANELVHIHQNTVDTIPFRSWDRIEENWATFKNSDRNLLLNFPSGLTIDLDSTTTLEEHSMNFVSVAFNERLEVYNAEGNAVDLTAGSASFKKEYIRLKSEKMDRLILSNRTYDLPEGVRRFNFDGNQFQYSTEQRTVRMDLFGNVKMDVPYANIEKAGFDRYIFLDNGKNGVMNGTGNEIIPARYFQIRPEGKNYRVIQPSGTGIVSGTGAEIVPSRYKSISKQGDMYIVQTTAGLYGVYSARKKGIIVPPKFRRISVSKDRIRGWLGQTLQIAFYNEAHDIEKTLTLNNTVSRFKLAEESRGYDTRLLGIGWFFEEKPVFDNEGFNIGSKRKWGVKDAGDSVITKPKFPDPKFVPTASFSMIPVGTKETEFMGKKTRKRKIFNVVDLNTGRVLPGQFLEIDTTDALTRDYIRYTSNAGFGYFTRDNKMHPVLHFDRENDTYLRFTTSETGNFQVVESEERESVRMSSFKLNNPDKPEYANWTFKDKIYNQVVLPDAKWNFLKPNGETLFDTSFDFADRFYRNTATVKRDGKWGVVNPDTLFIPCEYSLIKRMKAFNDTVFMVRKTELGKRFLNRSSNEISHEITRVIKVRKEYAIVASGNRQFVLNPQHEIVSDEGQGYRVLNERYFLIRKNRKSYVIDSKGNAFADIDAKPRDVFFDQILLYRDGSRFGLVNDRGDTLLTHAYKSIEAIGDLILAKGKDTRVFNKDGEELFQFDVEKVLIDSVTNRLAVNKSGKITIYEVDGTKVRKLNEINPDVFINNMLIEFGTNGSGTSVLEEGPKLPSGIKAIESAGNSGYIIETKEGFQLVDLNWELHKETGRNVYDRCRYLGEGVVFIKRGNSLFSMEHGMHHFQGSAMKTFDSGLLLVFLPEEGKYCYVTPEGVNPFEQKFKNAKPFKDGYASVKMRNGWTIIDANGSAKSLDSYGAIEVHGNGIFSTASGSLHGLIDHHGKVILETNYERLKIINGNTIQAVKDGEILYFQLDGTLIVY